ncbi:hypothetical protein [Streptomyces sp. NPDC053048]|uniref:DUF7544 domain-containing protein n=1 Tax=Streptomyces sp. NPDC053048 TaxID=3365694 RepID=UPI0037D8147A
MEMNDSPGATPPGWGRARADSGGGRGGDGGGDGGGQGGAGWGGPGNGRPGGGWGSPWQQQAPQPGVIPLRPLSVGEILEGTFSTMRLHWRTVLGVSLGVAVCTQTVATVVTGLWFPDMSENLDALDENAELDELLRTFRKGLSGAAAAGIVGLVGSIFATAILTFVVSRAVLGRPVTMREAWANARPRLLGMAGLFCLVPLLIVGSFVLGLAPGLVLGASGADEGATASLMLLGGTAGLVAAVWLWIRYSLAAPALMLEKQGVIESMRRSAKLVQGAWGRIFGIQILAAFLAFMIGALVQIPAALGATIFTGDLGEGLEGWPLLISNGISATIASTFTLPITAGVTALLYMDQRIRRESLDIELARAAGE